MEINLDVTPLFDKILGTDAKIIVMEGGSGSSKTISFLQALLLHSFQVRGAVFTITRASMPTIKRSCLRDFKWILHRTGMDALFDENKTDHVYTNQRTGTIIEFFAFDEVLKAQGPRRERLYVNEANEMAEDVVSQLLMRTRGQVYFDYNPVMQKSWIYDKILPREDTDHILSTYKDNPFLTDAEIRELEVLVPIYKEDNGRELKDWNLDYKGKGRLIGGDPYRWAVYGLGQRGAPGEAIYPICHTAPFPADSDFEYGLDFGYNHAMVLGRTAEIDKYPQSELYVDEIVHESYLTIEDLHDLMVERGVERKRIIWADASRPDSIKRLTELGWRCRPAPKGPGSVYNGIQHVKGYRLYFSERSHQGKAQCENYRWKKKADGTVDDEPVKIDDDCPDMIRYSRAPHLGKVKKTGKTKLITM